MTNPMILLFVVDGMRPDGLQEAATPVMDRLMAGGASTLKARAVSPTITLPCHASIFHGVSPARHGVVTNTWTPMDNPVPGLVDLFHAAGRDTAIFYSWEQLRDLWRPGAMTFSIFHNIYHNEAHHGLQTVMDHDWEITRHAVHNIVKRRPAFAFVYLGGTDLAGHDHGWMSPSYLRAIAGADAMIGAVLDALREAGMAATTTTLVVADHGGHDQGHGRDIPEDLMVPWLLHGAGVRAGHRIDAPVTLEDTAPTLAHLAGLQRPEAWTGRVITEALA